MSTYYTRFLYYLKNKFVGGIELFKRSATKLHIFIDIQGPTFLLPQKKDAPSLLVFDTGKKLYPKYLHKLQIESLIFIKIFIFRRIIG